MIEQLSYIHRQLEERKEAIAFERLLNVRVRKLTIEDKDFESPSFGAILSTTMEHQIIAYGQYYFLLNASQLPIGTKITSDTNVLWIEDGMPDDMVEEFSGNIEIVLPLNTIAAANGIKQVLFYQVIPKPRIQH